MKQDRAAAPSLRPELERWAYNPLTKTPFVDLGDSIVAPQPRFILRTITPGGLYYAGLAKWGRPFTDDLSILVENYVGRQSGLLSGDTVSIHSEVTYGKSQKKSVDFFIVTAGFVILVEVKSGRPTLGARAGDTDLEKSVSQVLKYAVNQIERSSELVCSGNPKFAHIPNDRPIYGLVVTAEPFYIGNSTFIRPYLGNPTMPVHMASLRDLEDLATIGPEEFIEHMPRIFTDTEFSTGVISTAFDRLGIKRGKNPILEQAWDEYPWPSGTARP